MCTVFIQIMYGVSPLLYGTEPTYVEIAAFLVVIVAAGTLCGVPQSIWWFLNS